jgi:hypothetical protein
MTVMELVNTSALRMRKRMLAATAISVVSLAVVPAAASFNVDDGDYEDDGEALVPANACHVKTEPGQTLARSMNGHFIVTSSGATVACPVEMPQETQEGERIDVYVRNYAGTSRCYLRVTDPYEATFSDDDYLVGSGGGAQLSVEVPYTSNWMAQVYCIGLDKDEGLRSYQWYMHNF